MSKKLQKILNLLSKGETARKISNIIFSTNNSTKLINYLKKNNIDLKQYKAFKYMDKKWLSEQLKKYNNSPVIMSRELDMSLALINKYAIEFGLRKPKKSIASVNPVNEKYFDEINNFKKAYWLGFIMADGYTYKTPNREKYELAIKIKSTDIDHLKEFAKDIEFPEEKITTGSNKRNGNINYYCSLRTYNTHLVTTVMNKHKIVQNKTYVQCLPDSIPEKYISDFIRGYWDGNGSIKKSGWSACTMSFQLIKSFVKYFDKNNIEYTLTQQLCKSGNYLHLIRIRSKSHENFIELIYPPKKYALKRKYDLIYKSPQN